MRMRRPAGAGVAAALIASLVIAVAPANAADSEPLANPVESDRARTTDVWLTAGQMYLATAKNDGQGVPSILWSRTVKGDRGKGPVKIGPAVRIADLKQGESWDPVNVVADPAGAIAYAAADSADGQVSYRSANGRTRTLSVGSKSALTSLNGGWLAFTTGSYISTGMDQVAKIINVDSGTVWTLPEAAVPAGVSNVTNRQVTGGPFLDSGELAWSTSVAGTLDGNPVTINSLYLASLDKRRGVSGVRIASSNFEPARPQTLTEAPVVSGLNEHRMVWSQDEGVIRDRWDYDFIQHITTTQTPGRDLWSIDMDNIGSTMLILDGSTLAVAHYGVRTEFSQVYSLERAGALRLLYEVNAETDTPAALRGDLFIHSLDRRSFQVVSLSGRTVTVDQNAVALSVPSLTGLTERGKSAVALAGTSIGVSEGLWNRAVTTTYQWKVNGKAIKGATTASYTPSRDQIGKRLSVEVRAVVPGGTGATLTTTPVSIVR